MLNTGESPERLSGAWRSTLYALVGLCLLQLVVYHASFEHLLQLWLGSENYAHAIVVPPISAWLIWRRRRALMAMTPAPAPLALLLLALVGLIWLVGAVGTLNTAVHFALIAGLVVLVPLVAGLAVARALLFPLAFMFFGVPFGEFLFPIMMDATADFTVAAVRLSGVPVYREGLQFVIPSGHWSVVEACSGLRYLIASSMVGVLFAYLNFRAWRKRLAFVGVALAVPIVANWLRAYMIVMIGHLSDNRLAVGVDHIIAGWVFFGFVMFLMFAIGSRFADSTIEDELQPAQADGVGPTTPSRLWGTSVVAALLVALPAVLAGKLLEPRWTTPPVLVEWSGSPSPHWRVAQTPPVDWAPDLLPPHAVQRLSLTHTDGAQVGVYVGYYRNQDAQHKLISSENHLVNSRSDTWAVVRTGVNHVEQPGGPWSVVEVDARTLREPSRRMIIWQAYWVDGHWTQSEARAKLAGLLQRLKGRGDDGATVILFAEASTPGGAEAALTKFVQDNLPQIERQLLQAGG